MRRFLVWQTEGSYRRLYLNGGHCLTPTAFCLHTSGRRRPSQPTVTGEDLLLAATSPLAAGKLGEAVWAWCGGWGGSSLAGPGFGFLTGGTFGLLPGVLVALLVTRLGRKCGGPWLRGGCRMALALALATLIGGGLAYVVALRPLLEFSLPLLM
jgi:hypothetical protein